MYSTEPLIWFINPSVTFTSGRNIHNNEAKDLPIRHLDTITILM